MGIFLRPGHKLWSYAAILAQWREEGLDRYAMREKLIAEHSLKCGVDSIRYVLERTPRPDGSTAAVAQREAPEPVAPAKVRGSKVAKFYACGKPVVLATKNNARNGWKAGRPKPCRCLRCSPLEDRQRKWGTWQNDWYMGNYRCSGVGGIVGCGEVKFCAGPDRETMVCRDCLGLPPLVRPEADAVEKPVRRKAA